MRRIENWLDGLPTSPATSNFTPVQNPATERVAFEVVVANELDVVRAVQSARRAFKTWGETSPAARQDLWRAFMDNDLDREGLARDVCETLGRPITLARRDVDRAIAEGRVLAARACATNSARGGDGHQNLSQPVGVVAVIVGRERPVSFLVQHLAAAILSGNTVVIKASPVVAAICRRVVEALKAPPGVVNLLHGPAELGQFLVRHPGVARVAFCGESRLGPEVLRDAAPLIKPVYLELSTKNVIIVMKDADLPKVVPRILKAALDGFPKILVADELFKEAERLLGEALPRVVVGDPSLETTEVGPLGGDIAEFKRWRNLGLSENGRPLGEVADHGAFVRPVIFSELTNCSEIHQNAVAGPLVTLNSFKYVTDAIKWANTSPFGGAVSVWTKNLNQALKMADELDVDEVVINDIPAAPAGGRKLSGFGDADVLAFHAQRKRVCFSS